MRRQVLDLTRNVINLSQGIIQFLLAGEAIRHWAGGKGAFTRIKAMSLFLDISRARGQKAIRVVVALTLGLTLMIGGGEARAGSCAAESVVVRAASAFEAAAREGSVSAYTRVLQRHASVTGLALFALGPYRRDLKGRLRSQYIRLATHYMARVMSDYSQQILGGKLAIEDCFPQNGAMLVKSRIGSTHLTWRVSGQRISDVKVEGIWLALTLRSNFVQVLRDHDGDPQALIKYLGDS